MRFNFLLFLLAVIGLPLASETAAEAPKEEAPASPSSLSIALKNFTNYDAIIAVHASEKGSKTHVIIVQNTVLKNSNLALAKYFPSTPGVAFSLVETSVVIDYDKGLSQKLSCEIAKDADGKAPTDIKKTIDIFLFPSAQGLPTCTIYFDLDH